MRLKVPLYYKNSSFSNNLSNFNDVAGRVFETPDLENRKSWTAYVKTEPEKIEMLVRLSFMKTKNQEAIYIRISFWKGLN